MSAHAGRTGVVYIAIESATGVATNTIKLNAWTINRATDKFEVTSFADTNKTYVQGLPDVQGSISGFWDDTETKPFGGAHRRAEVFGADTLAHSRDIVGGSQNTGELARHCGFQFSGHFR